MVQYVTVTDETNCASVRVGGSVDRLSAGRYPIVEHNPARGLLMIDISDDENPWQVLVDPDNDPAILLRHPDPAVDALIEHGWLDLADRRVTVDDLVAAVRDVRQADLHAAGTPVRVEWSAETTHTDRIVTHSIPSDESYAALIADSKVAHLATLNEPTRALTGVVAVAVVNREVRILPDGTQIIGPWRHVRAADPARTAGE